MPLYIYLAPQPLSGPPLTTPNVPPILISNPKPRNYQLQLLSYGDSLYTSQIQS